MKGATVLSLLLVAGTAHADDASPIGKVLQLIGDLQSKIIGEGEESQKVYEEFSEWCEERSKNLAYDIKTGNSEVASLKATISEEAAMIASLTTKTEELASAIATDEADLKAATFIREKESADFAAEKGELMDIIDTLERAIGILERHGASMLQLKNAKSVAQALDAMVGASMFSQADAQRLTALVQGSEEDGGDNLGAPSAAVYEGHSGGIVATLTDLLEKAQAQLKEASGAETASLHNFQQLKQSIEDEIAYGKKELAEAKAGAASSAEKKAAAEGDLQATDSDLAEDVKVQGDLHQQCMTTAQDFEAEVKSRAEELKALAEAKKALTENTGAADGLAYGLSQVSLIQKLSTGADLAHFEAVRYVRDLARKQNSKALAQLASRMASAMRMSSGDGADPFAKVKGLIQDIRNWSPRRAPTRSTRPTVTRRSRTRTRRRPTASRRSRSSRPASTRCPPGPLSSRRRLQRWRRASPTWPRPRPRWTSSARRSTRSSWRTRRTWSRVWRASRWPSRS
ncbi:unnamed protein product [Prorocentrum cordatum]|uniref:Uncharacterized protein n=1 Tax=Prorocentrum cordatum TaxID=2364126 RepID=A0ABN9U6Z3_9DINO|nr:unnamed protein product [Polarella glacialis]